MSRKRGGRPGSAAVDPFRHQAAGASAACGPGACLRYANRADIAARRKQLVGAVDLGKLRLGDIDSHVHEPDAAFHEVEAEAAARVAELAGLSSEGRHATLTSVEAVMEAWDRPLAPGAAGDPRDPRGANRDPVERTTDGDLARRLRARRRGRRGAPDQ